MWMGPLAMEAWQPHGEEDANNYLSGRPWVRERLLCGPSGLEGHPMDPWSWPLSWRRAPLQACTRTCLAAWSALEARPAGLPHGGWLAPTSRQACMGTCLANKLPCSPARWGCMHACGLATCLKRSGPRSGPPQTSQPYAPSCLKRHKACVRPPAPHASERASA